MNNKLLIFLLSLPAFSYGQLNKDRSEYVTKTGATISVNDSVRILRAPFVFTYPRPNVDNGTQIKRAYYLERSAFMKTYPIAKFYRTKARTKKMVDVIVLNIDQASPTSKDAEFYIEIEKALAAGEVEIVKAAEKQ